MATWFLGKNKRLDKKWHVLGPYGPQVRTGDVKDRYDQVKGPYNLPTESSNVAAQMLRRELAGEESDSEDESEHRGKRNFFQRMRDNDQPDGSVSETRLFGRNEE